MREQGKKKLEVKKEERVRRGEREREPESRGGFSAEGFVLLAQWPSVNATHRASLLEHRGYL